MSAWTSSLWRGFSRLPDKLFLLRSAAVALACVALSDSAFADPRLFEAWRLEAVNARPSVLLRADGTSLPDPSGDMEVRMALRTVELMATSRNRPVTSARAVQGTGGEPGTIEITTETAVENLCRRDHGMELQSMGPHRAMVQVLAPAGEYRVLVNGAEMGRLTVSAPPRFEAGSDYAGAVRARVQEELLRIFGEPESWTATGSNCSFRAEGLGSGAVRVNFSFDEVVVPAGNGAFTTYPARSGSVDLPTGQVRMECDRRETRASYWTLELRANQAALSLSKIERDRTGARVSFSAFGRSCSAR